MAMSRHWNAAAGAKNPRFVKAITAAYQARNHDEVNALVDEYRAEFAAEAAKTLYRTRLSKLKENIRKECWFQVPELGSGAGSTIQRGQRWTGGYDQLTLIPQGYYLRLRTHAEG